MVNRLLLNQIMSSNLRVATPLIAYAHALKRMFDNNPDLTVDDLSNQLGLSPDKIRSYLKLLRGKNRVAVAHLLKGIKHD